MHNNLNIKSTFDPIGFHDRSGKLILVYSQPITQNLSNIEQYWDNLNKELYQQIIKKKNHA